MIVSVLVIVISGCSFGLTTADPMRAAHVEPRCDNTKGLVAVDWVIAAIGATAALAAVEDAPEGAALLALGSAIFIASAVRGNGVVNRCREAFDQYAMAQGAPLEVADQPRTFEDPYAEPPDLPARRIVKPPPVAAMPAVSTPPVTPVTPVAKPAGKPAPATAPASAPADDEDWADFWTELP